MRCPFLVECEVRYCEAAPLKVLPAPSAGVERCASPAYVDCPFARPHPGPPGNRCPFLHETFGQTCSAAPLRRFVPSTGDSPSRCTSSAHRYCEVYLSLAAPAPGAYDTGGEEEVDADGLPRHLAVTASHMWLDVAEDRSTHVGMDRFFADLFDRVDGIEPLTPRGPCRPTVLFTVGEARFAVSLPCRLEVSEVNREACEDPSLVLRDPYGRGWLFRATAPAELLDHAHPDLPLLRGEAARAWLRDERSRLTRWVHDALGESDGARVACDGGTPCRGLGNDLDTVRLRRLVETFFGDLLPRSE